MASKPTSPAGGNAVLMLMGLTLVLIRSKAGCPKKARPLFICSRGIRGALPVGRVLLPAFFFQRLPPGKAAANQPRRRRYGGTPNGSRQKKACRPTMLAPPPPPPPQKALSKGHRQRCLYRCRSAPGSCAWKLRVPLP